jgi:hypothetical protein
MKIDKSKLIKFGIPIGILLIAGIGFFIWKRKKANESTEEDTASTTVPAETTTQPSQGATLTQKAASTNTQAATTGVKFTSALNESTARPYAKFEVPGTSGFKVGDTIKIVSPLYNGTTKIVYVWKDSTRQHIFTTVPFKGTSAGTLSK